MKIWKRNAIIASVLLLVCAGVYLNWSKAQKTDVQDLTETLSAEQVMGEGTLVVADSESLPQEAVAASTSETQAADYFAQVRLSRQESRDSAVELLEETIAYDEGTEVGEAACQTLNNIVGTALSEAQIESLVIAKGYDDCVTYINDGVVCVAVFRARGGTERRGRGADLGYCDLADGLYAFPGAHHRGQALIFGDFQKGIAF